MGFSLKDDQRFQQRLMGAAAVADAAITALPDAVLPPLHGIAVTCALPAVTTEDVERVLSERLLAAATKTDREPGDDVEAGDEVRVTILGYCNGVIVPGVVRDDLWMRVEDDGVLLGLADELIGVPVGATHTCAVELGSRFGVKSFRGRQITVGVKVHEARAIEVPNGDDDDVWKRLGFGNSVEDAVKLARERLTQEQEELAPLLAVRAILSEIAKTATVEIPTALLEANLTRRWQESEGEMLAKAGMDIDEQNQSFKAWLALAELRESSREELRLLSVAKALVSHLGLSVTDEVAEPFYAEMASADGKTTEALKTELASDPKLFAEYEDILIRHILSERLLQSFPVTFIEPPADPQSAS